MSASVELHSYDKKHLIKSIADKCNTDDINRVTEILDQFGDTIGDRYIILNNEFWRYYNNYYNVCDVLARVFNAEGVFDCFLNDITEEELNNGVAVDEALESLCIDWGEWNG